MKIKLNVFTCRVSMHRRFHVCLAVFHCVCVCVCFGVFHAISIDNILGVTPVCVQNISTSRLSIQGRCHVRHWLIVFNGVPPSSFTLSRSTIFQQQHHFVFELFQFSWNVSLEAHHSSVAVHCERFQGNRQF